MSPIIVSFSIAILCLLIIVRARTAHVVCEHDALTLRFAKTLGRGEMLQVEHRGEGRSGSVMADALVSPSSPYIYIF